MMVATTMEVLIMGNVDLKVDSLHCKKAGHFMTNYPLNTVAPTQDHFF